MRSSLTCAFLVATSAIACSDDRSRSLPTEVTLDQGHVTGNVAAALNAEGQFTLHPYTWDAWPQITESQAVALATAFVRDYGPLFRSTIEKGHGRPIDFASLHQCGRVYYAESPYLSLPPSTFHQVVRHLGADWLVSFCGRDGTPQVSQSVSAHATHLSLENGEIRWNAPGGSEFSWAGIGPSGELPITPERAVQLVAARTGRKVVEVPRLIITPHHTGQFARWRIVLEAEALARPIDGNATTPVTEIWVGMDKAPGNPPTTFIADPTRDRFAVYHFPMPVGDITSSVVQPVPLPRRAEVPAALVKADLRHAP